MTRPEFDASLREAQPPSGLNLPLTSLWWISNNHWERAHDLIDRAPGPDCAWVHAYLHRVEGDDANARYWYVRSGRDKPAYGLAQERQVMIDHFLALSQPLS